MWESDYKESWAPKNWCFWTVVLEKTLENPLDCKEIQPVHPKGNHPWIFIGRTDAEAETPILRLPDVKNWLIGKIPEAGKDWRLEEKGTTGDEMVDHLKVWDGSSRGLKAGEGDDRGWDERMSQSHRLNVWVNSRSWWWTGRPCILQSMGSQRVRHDWATELNWAELRVPRVYLKTAKPGLVVSGTTVIPCISLAGLTTHRLRH